MDMSDELKTERVAIRIAIRIREGGTLAGGVLRRTVAYHDRDVFPDALALAIRRRWLVLDGRHVLPGEVTPPPTTARWYRALLDASSTKG